MAFETRTDTFIGGTTNDIKLIDLNGDNRLDFVTASGGGADSVQIKFGLGDGSFEDGARYYLGGIPASVVVQDINGDNEIDIVTANQALNNVTVLLGQGGGAFGNQANYTTGAEPSSVALADVNGDDRIDILVANGANSSNTFSVLFGQSGDTFATRVNYTVGNSPKSIAVGDVNGDGLFDVITANAGSSDVSVSFGEAGGTFSDSENYPVGQNPYSVALADLNNDGRLDIVTANSNSSNVTVLLGQLNGSFAGREEYATGGVGGPVTVTLGDVNGDGILDIVTSNNNSDGSVSVLLGQVGGIFALSETLAVGSNNNAVALGDVNGDGRIDIVTGGSNGISVLLAETTTYTVAVSPDSAVEGNTGSGNELTYTVTRSGDTSQPGSVAVNFTGTATFGTDYTSTVGNGDLVSFLADETSKTFTVTTTPDTTVESDETVIATISNVNGGGVIGVEASATGTIIDDEPVALYAITASPNEVLEGDTGPGNTVTYTVTRSGDVSQAGSVTVNFDGRATFGSDYTSTVANGETISFLANETSKSFIVTTTPDLEIERTEAVRATISNVQGDGRITEASAISFITNDDQLTRFAIAVSPASVAEGNTGSGNTLTFTVTRSGDTSEENTIFVDLSGSATLGTDYTVANLDEFGRISFQPGETSKTFTVTTTPDATIEPNETVTASITIFDIFEGSFSISATGTITNDDGIVTPQPQPQPGTPPQTETPTQPSITQGTPGNDTLTGTAGSDIVSGGVGDDALFGNQGDDVLNGNQGADTVRGGQGNDIVRGGQDDDEVQGDRGDDQVFGDNGNDVVNGNQGNDTVNGGMGNDVVHGGQDNDEVRGGQGDDFVFGDLGNDQIWGDLGNDTLSGGAGADLFRFAANSGNDVVTDFSRAEGDTLDFGGQTYTVADVNGSAVFTLSGGGTIVLTGVASASLDAGAFA